MKTILTLSSLLAFSVLARGLDCWNCVGEDCDGDMGFSKFAYKETCESGAQCQTTTTYFIDPEKGDTFVTKPVKSCSFRIGCIPTSEIELKKCKGNTKLWQSYGCYWRTCCDSDLCNK